jgi:hypothetical protein
MIVAAHSVRHDIKTMWKTLWESCGDSCGNRSATRLSRRAFPGFGGRLPGFPGVSGILLPGFFPAPLNLYLVFMILFQIFPKKRKFQDFVS